MLDQLSRTDRLRLMKFVCSFAWADLKIRPEEIEFVARIADGLELDEEDRAKVSGWLASPPSPESVDPMLIPHKHRQLFLDSVHGIIVSDGEISPEERENFALLEALLN